MDRYICIHGHFYQPPRENPWLESIEIQDSAHPFHDWNERITSECYGPNATARILDSNDNIERIINNYAKISFNFGPTLLSWMQERYPHIYQAILEADKESIERFSGHGSAIAQSYNHIILPLANKRDKITQVKWGIQDFHSRFGRHPEAMWLAETAVDTETLEVLAEEGIRYTILAPHQAKRIRSLEGGEWQDVPSDTIDTRRSYLAKLPSGKEISLFFYNGGLSRSVAFERLLTNGEHFAQRLVDAFPPDTGGLSHIATDGETYGHHHRYGDMALAYALQSIERKEEVTLTNYGEFLERFPPQFEVEIVDNTSWSCAHGIERWRSDCGCNSGGNHGWNQAWRGPLRDALDWLRDRVEEQFQAHAKALFHDPEEARNAYIKVILQRSTEQVEQFFQQHCTKKLSSIEQNTALKLLETRRNAMLMYTSCGWFFDEISGIETTQIIQYAGRVIQLSETFEENPSLEEGFLSRLEQAPSNVPELRDGRGIYDKFVRPNRVDFPKLAAHYAATSLFVERKELTQLYSYSIREIDYIALQAGRAKLALGQVEVQSNITWGRTMLSFGVLHLGDHNISGGVRAFQSEEQYKMMCKKVKTAFLRAEFPEVLRLLDAHFLELSYSMRTLFRDQQREILDRMLATTLKDTQMMAQRLYQQHAPLLRYLTSLEYPLPEAIQSTISFVINTRLKEALNTHPLPLEQVRTLLEEAKETGVQLDQKSLSFDFQKTLEMLAETWSQAPEQTEHLQHFVHAASLIHTLPFEINLYDVQNAFYKQLQRHKKSPRASSEQTDTSFKVLGKALRITVG